MIQINIAYYSIVWYLARWHFLNDIAKNSSVYFFFFLIWWVIRMHTKILSFSDLQPKDESHPGVCFQAVTALIPQPQCYTLLSAVSCAFRIKVAGDWLKVSWVSACVAWVGIENKINLSLSRKNCTRWHFSTYMWKRNWVLCWGVHIHRHWQFNSPFIRL